VSPTIQPTQPPRSIAEPARPSPARPAAEPPRAQPKVAAALPDIKKPADPKKPPDKLAKHPAPPERTVRTPARAQPLDPYAAPAAAPDKPRADPGEAYKTGLQQYARGDTSGALSTFRTSLAINPNFAPTWRGLGLVYEKLGNKTQARSAFRRYLQLAPTAADADQVRDRLERL
jgi:tetratricopeptide (TPR) repeat protein